MKLLALDLSIRETGIAIYKDNEIVTNIIQPEKVIQKEVERTSKEKKKGEQYYNNWIKAKTNRLLNIVFQINKYINQIEPKVIIIEAPAYNAKNTKSLVDLGEVHGMIKLLAFKKKIGLYYIVPTTLKKHIAQKGNAKKELILKELYKKYNVDISNNNEADAYALIKYYLEKVICQK